MRLPTQIKAAWIDALPDADLRVAEERLYDKFSKLDRSQRRTRGAKYTLFSSPPATLDAWDRWTRVSTAMRVRALSPHRT